MLALSRFPGESIMIGDDIEVMVSRVMGSKVRLAIRAPKHVLVNRKEVTDGYCHKKSGLSFVNRAPAPASAAHCEHTGQSTTTTKATVLHARAGG